MSAESGRGADPKNFAEKVSASAKTVERWLRFADRVPHRSTRREVARVLSVDEVHLWPQLADDVRTEPATENELVALYPNRSQVPPALWSELVGSAKEAVDVLVYSGTFLVEQYNFLQVA